MKYCLRFFFIFISFIWNQYCFSQKNIIWQRTYGLSNRFDNIYSAKSTYDNGFVLGITASSENPNDYFIWLVKTDINGVPLWSKSYINPYSLFVIKSMDVSINGDIVITGATEQYDDWGDVFLMRLNSCGEKIWCKVIHYDDMNYGYRVKINHQGNYALYTRYAAPSSINSDKLWILNMNGDILSQIYIIPSSSHPNVWSPLTEDFMLTEDHGFVFSGHCYFPEDTINPSVWRLQHMLVKLDSTGNELFFRPQYLDTNQEGVLLCSIEHGTILYSCGYDYGYSDKKKPLEFTIRPYNGKYSSTGALLYEKRLHPDTMRTFLTYIKSINAQSLIQTGKITHDPSGNPPYYLGVFKTDTMFNILNYLENDTGSVTNECITGSIDGKFLVTGYCPPQSAFTEVDGLAIKVNSDLEYDSLYTFPFIYDSLCPFPIITDTIDCDCDLITGFGEPVKLEDRYALKVFPNPAGEVIHFKFLDRAGDMERENKEILLFGLMGKPALKAEIGKEVSLNVSHLPAGVYVAIVLHEMQVITREKVVIIH